MDADTLVRGLVEQGIRDARVLDAMRQVPRERFVLPKDAGCAWLDCPLPIGFGQTISQPFVVAFMTEELRLSGAERVLEVGTGSGYQSAVLAKLCATVYSIEIVPELLGRARRTLAALGILNVETRLSDGWLGWPEEAPFDAALCAAAARAIPPALLEQIRDGGRLVLPVGDWDEQVLLVLRREGAGPPIVEKRLPVRFVQMMGLARDACARRGPV